MIRLMTALAELKYILVFVGNDAYTSNTDKTMDGSASEKIPTNNVIVTNSANQHSRINYNTSPNANVPYGAASSLQHVPSPPNFD